MYFFLQSNKENRHKYIFFIIFYFCHDSSGSRIEKSILIDYQVDQPLKCKSFSVWRGLLSFNISQGKKTVAMRVHLVAADTLHRKGIVEVLLKLTRWSKALSLWRGYWLFCSIVWQALLYHDTKKTVIFVGNVFFLHLFSKAWCFCSWTILCSTISPWQSQQDSLTYNSNTRRTQ